MSSDENASASSLNDGDGKNVRREKVEAGTYDAHHGTVRAGLEEVDQGLENRPPWLLTTTEVKLLGIAGVGFFLDGVSLWFRSPTCSAHSFSSLQRTIYLSST